jgi:hypothetical protein
MMCVFSGWPEKMDRSHAISNRLSAAFDGVEMTDGDWMELMMLMAQGTRLAFDARTHRRGVRSYNRLNYVFLASRLLQDAEAV